jgi:hypothetical protein
VRGEKLEHAEATNTVSTENLCHLFVGFKKLLVSGILEIVLLDVNPQFLDAFTTASLFLAYNVSEVIAKLHGFGESGFYR